MAQWALIQRREREKRDREGGRKKKKRERDEIGGGKEFENVQQALSAQPDLQCENQDGASSFFGGLIWGGMNMPIKPGVRAFASGGFQVNPAAVCLM